MRQRFAPVLSVDGQLTLDSLDDACIRAATLLDTADELKLPDDPEFRSALVGYLEWGSRLVVINSKPGSGVNPHNPMPKWGWVR